MSFFDVFYNSTGLEPLLQDGGLLPPLETNQIEKTAGDEPPPYEK